MNITPCGLKRKDCQKILTSTRRIKLWSRWHKKSPHSRSMCTALLSSPWVHPHTKKPRTQHACGKFETKHTVHEGQFWNLLLHINPPASPHCAHTAALPSSAAISSYYRRQEPPAGHQSSAESHPSALVLRQMHQIWSCVPFSRQKSNTLSACEAAACVSFLV